jgi:hypothetical protein
MRQLWDGIACWERRAWAERSEVRLACHVITPIVLLLLMASHLLAADIPATSVQTRLDRVALFKNGLGFFSRSAQLHAGQMQALVGPFAAPVHGTFWVSAPASAGLGSVVARQVNVKGETVQARDLGDLLRANVGKEVTVWTSEEAAPIRGTILSFAPDRPFVIPLGEAYRLGATGDRGNSVIPWGRGEYVLIKTADGVVGINAYTVARLNFLGGEVGHTFQTDTPGAELTVSLRSPKAGDALGVSYLAKGLTWAPSYLIDITDPKMARLSASAVIVNEAEDLIDTHVDLITGFPNLQFADVISPMGKKTDLAAFLQQLIGQGPRPTAEVMMQRVTSNTLRADAWERRGPDYGAPMPGAAVEDLFFYPLERVTLKAGDTGYYPLFSLSVPYTHVYQWSIADYVSQSDYYARPQQPEAREVVWHSVRLTNTSKLPWTTAPAETTAEGQVLGQDTLDYTPAQAEVTVKITQAVSVKAEQNEIETEREREALRMYGDFFDRVTLQGTLRVTNYKDEAIGVEIEKTLSGEVKLSVPAAKVTTLAAGLARMNPTRKLTWRVGLKPGQTQEITYTYQALIRR